MQVVRQSYETHNIWLFDNDSAYVFDAFDWLKYIHSFSLQQAHILQYNYKQAS